jgi:acyl carrier protein
MAGPGTTDIEIGVIEAVKQVSRRPVAPVLESDLVADLGFDSLEVLELVAELEDRFDISVPVDDLPSARTVAQVIAHVARLVGERTPRA